MDSWVVLLLFFLFSFLGRLARKKRREEPPPRRPPRRPAPSAPPPRPHLPRPSPAPSRPEARLPQQQPRFELPPPWEPGGPHHETPPEWEIPAEGPPPWSLPDELGESATSPGEAPLRVLLERLSAAAAGATESRATEPGTAPAEAGAAPVLRAGRPESERLQEIRRSLGSTPSLRQALVLSAILGAPKARRR